MRLFMIFSMLLCASSCDHYKYTSGCKSSPELLRFKIGDVELHLPSSFFISFNLTHGPLTQTRKGAPDQRTKSNWGGNPKPKLDYEANPICQDEDDGPMEVDSLVIHNFGILSANTSVHQATLPNSVSFFLNRFPRSERQKDLRHSSQGQLEVYPWSDSVVFGWGVSREMGDWDEEQFRAYHQSLVEFLCFFQVTDNGPCVADDPARE